MPRYFFNRVDGALDPDLEGLVFASLEEAKREAMAFAADTLKGATCALWDGGDVRIEVINDAQSLIFTIVISISVEAAI